MNKAVFLDRDSPDDVYLLPEAPDAIKNLIGNGFMVFIVTNQAGIGLETILELADKHQIDLSRSFTVGDMRSDIIAGNAAGTRTVIEKDEVIPVIEERHMAYSLLDAAKQIVELAQISA